MCLAALPVALQAQEQKKDTTLVRTVVVEQEYNPDIMDAAKVNVLPRVEPPAVSKKAVAYDEKLMPATRIPAGLMQPYSGQEAQEKATAGYARLGYGNNNNLDLQAVYRFALTDQDRLNLQLGMDGMNGKLDMGEGQEKWKSRYYRTRAGVDYQHRFRNLDFNLGGHFGLSNFNFMPGWEDSKQKFTAGDVHLGLRNRNKDLALDYALETNLLLYQRQHDPAAADAGESLVRTKAEVSGDISDGQLIRIGFYMDNALYRKAEFDNCTSIGLNPAYRFHNNDWQLTLGAHVDMAFGFGKQFRAAPDMQVQYNFSDSYLLYAQATGGKRQNDFRQLESYNPYGQLYNQLDATYEQLNAAIGFKASPADELWLHVYAGYQDLKDDLFVGIDYSVGGPESNYRLLLNQADARNIYVGGALDYSYKQLFGFHASAVYRNWSTPTEESAVYAESMILGFKPALEADARIDVQPLSALRFSLGYRHIGRSKVESERADAVSDLYLSAHYELFRNILVYARLNNLLNKDYQYYEGCPAQGINFLGGVSFRF